MVPFASRRKFPGLRIHRNVSDYVVDIVQRGYTLVQTSNQAANLHLVKLIILFPLERSVYMKTKGFSPTIHVLLDL